jgi:hypothetical protein
VPSDDSSAGNELKITARQLGRGLKLKTGQVHTLTLVPPQLSFSEFDGALFSHNCSALMASTGEKPSEEEAEPLEERLGISMVARSLQFIGQTSQRWLVVGHTDTTASAAYNGPLSRHRARCVLGLLLGDREMFKVAANAPHLSSKDERLSVQRPTRKAILQWAHEEFAWPCRLEDNNGNETQAIRDFQLSYNLERTVRRKNPELAIDGDFGPLTWGAVFDCYEFELARHLLVPVEKMAAFRNDLGLRGRAAHPEMALGLGEHCPIEEEGRDNFRSALNKRAEVLFFDEGEIPPITQSDGICSQAQSEWYRNLSKDRLSLPLIAWQFPHQAVQSPESRRVVVQAPALKDGEVVKVTITQIVENEELTVIDETPVLVFGGKAALDFPELDSDTIFQGMPEKLAPSQTFVDFSYRAKAVVRGFSFFSRRLPVMTERPLAFYNR